MNYAWLLKHALSGHYLKISCDPVTADFNVTVVGDPRDAEHFETQTQAIDVRDLLCGSLMLMRDMNITVEDRAFHEHVEDADKTPVPTRAELIRKALGIDASGHRPTARLRPHPMEAAAGYGGGEFAKPARARRAKATARKPKTTKKKGKGRK